MPRSSTAGGTIKNNAEARMQHQEACTALGIANYTMRDARHTYAVRMVKAGVPLIQIGKQLGHASTAMVSEVYGKYEPTQAERQHWEAVATARDAAIAKEGKK